MAQAHHYGRENECSIATVATMSFQDAKAFYEKLGYVVDFERPVLRKIPAVFFCSYLGTYVIMCTLIFLEGEGKTKASSNTECDLFAILLIIHLRRSILPTIMLI